jgi:hypothetical protein
MFIKLFPPMQSPKSPVNNAGVRSTSSVWVTPFAFVPDIVLVSSAAAAVGRIVLMTAKQETKVAAQDAGEEGNRAMVASVIIFYGGSK